MGRLGERGRSSLEGDTLSPAHETDALFPPPTQLSEEEERSVLDYDVTVATLIEKWKKGAYRKILVLAGAGISVSAGGGPETPYAMLLLSPR